MRKIIFASTVSLDGFVEDKSGSIGWTVPDEKLHRHFNEREQDIDLHLYGRKMHDTMSFWEDVTPHDDLPEYMYEYARIWKKADKMVFSTTLKETKFEAELKSELNPDEIRKMKTEEGKNIFAGGAELAGSLIKEGLLDEIWMYTCPILLGGGKPMLPQLDEHIMLRLMDVKTHNRGVVSLKYAINYNKQV